MTEQNTIVVIDREIGSGFSVHGGVEFVCDFEFEDGCEDNYIPSSCHYPTEMTTISYLNAALFDKEDACHICKFLKKHYEGYIVTFLMKAYEETIVLAKDKSEEKPSRTKNPFHFLDLNKE